MAETDYQLINSWANVDEAASNRPYYVTMNSATTADRTAYDVNRVHSTEPTRPVILVDTNGCKVDMIKAPTSGTDTAEFAKPNAPGYTKYVLDMAGNVTVTSENSGGAKHYGFISMTAYENFIRDYPAALAVGDYVIIRGGNEAGASHTIYTFNGVSASTQLTRVYGIDDWFVVTVSNSNGYVADKTFVQISEAYGAGKQPILVTEFGQTVRVVSADSTSIRFAGLVSVDSGFWVVDYTITASGVTGRALSCDFYPIFVSKVGSNWDVVSMPPVFNSPADIVIAIQNGANVCAVVQSETNYEYFIHRPSRYYGSTAITFSGPEVIQDGNENVCREVAYTIDASSHVNREVFPLGGNSGGTAEVTAAAVAAAVADMSSTQIENTRTALGAEESGAAAAVQTDLNTVKGKIPSAATSSNQLADKAFVNSSIATATATFRGTYTTMAQINAISTKDANDYVFLEETDSAGNTLYKRYKYNGSSWEFEYSINNSGFTAAQWAAINSGMTAETVADLPVFSNRNSATDTVEVKKDPITKKLYVPTYPSGSGSGGAEKLTVIVTTNGAIGTSNKLPSEAYAADQSGDVVEFIADGVKGWVQVLTSTEIYAYTIETGGGEPILFEYSISAAGVVSVSTHSLGDMFEPALETRTAVQLAAGLALYENTVYEITGAASGFALSNVAWSSMRPGQAIEIRLTTGSTAITTPTWPGGNNAVHFLDGWDGTRFEANTFYKILIDDVGNVMCGTRGVTA